MYDVPFTLRPIDVWPGAEAVERVASPFSAPWSATTDLLDRELRMIGASDVVMQVALRESDLRLDGRPRANARPSHPGVILAFGSTKGPLRYAVDTYTNWQDNVRAIALTLEKLRACDRYGAVRDGQQYAGWRQIGTGSEARRKMTQAEAVEFMARHGRILHPIEGASLATWTSAAYKLAARRLHPDVAGGDTNLFAQLTEAREVLQKGQTP